LDKLTIVGRFGRVHGLQGFITVHSFTEPRNNIANYAQWYVNIAQQWQPLEIIKLEKVVKHILVQVAGYKDLEAVAVLTNLDIAIKQEQLPSLLPGEYYWHELIGMQVVSANSFVFGQITEIMPTGSNDVLIVQGERRHLVPYIPEQVIISIDREKRVIVADWDHDF
jgi:16S rRNA processing protein RimM